MSVKYKKKYKCPYCDERFERAKLADHIEKKHNEMIPEGYTASRVAFNTMNNKTRGKCIMCGKETDWNEDKCRYERICNSKRCHDDYVKLVEERLKAARGVTRSEMLSDPHFQDKMLKGRSISGTYKFSDGGKLEYVGNYEKNFLEFMDKFLHVKSIDIQAPGPTIEYYYEGKKHFWITDFYYIPYNLVLDIKDGGKNPNKREMPEYRAKQKAKEKAIKSLGEYNYLRLTDNQFDQLLDVMLELKDAMIDLDGPFEQKISKMKPIIKINEAYIRLLNDYKDPDNCGWDEECTYHNILDAMGDRAVDTSKIMHVYDMDPKTYKKKYMGCIESDKEGEYHWTKINHEYAYMDTSQINIKTSNPIIDMLAKYLTDPKTYLNKDLSEIKKYVESETDKYTLLDINTYLTTSLVETSERFTEYSKYLRSGKCVWQYQFDCEEFKAAGVKLDDIIYIRDYLSDIKKIAVDKLNGFYGDNLGATDGTNLRMTPAMLDRFYTKLKTALNESEINGLDDFDLEYLSEYVL